MRTRDITYDEFLKVTRGLNRYIVYSHGELTHHNQNIKSNNMEVLFATKFDLYLRISHLKIITDNKKGMIRPYNLILTNEYKRELYKILKSLSILNMN